MPDAPLPAWRPGHRRRGSAILLALLALVVLTALATTLTETAVSQAAQERERESQVALLVGSESVFNEALDWCQQNTEPIRELAVGSGLDVPPDPDTPRAGLTTYTARITKLRDVDVARWGDESFLLQATVEVGRSTDADLTGFHRRRIEAVIIPRFATFFSRAMFALAGYDVQGNFKTDSWNSTTTQNYATALANGQLTNNGDLGSNGTIIVNRPENVLGDVASNLNLTLPQTQFPVPTSITDVTLNGASTSLVGSAGGTNYHALSATVGNGNVLSISGGRVNLYIDGFLNLQGAVEFETVTDQLVIYQKDYATGETTLNFQGQTRIGTLEGQTLNGKPMPSRPQQLVLITAYTGEIKMAGGAACSGVVFAPAARVRLQGTADFYGAIIAGVFHGQDLADVGKVNATYSFHYDDALGSVDLGLVPTLQVNGWRPVTLGPGAP